jgi:hypothetical protein
MTEPSEKPIKALWQDQQEEAPAMTAEAIRALARNHNHSARNRLIVGCMLIAFEAAVFGWLALKAPNALARTGELLVVAGLAWMIWRFQLRRPRSLPDAAASAQTLLIFQRRELERRKSNYIWMLVSAAPVIGGALVTTAGLKMARHGAPNASLAPFFALLGVWFVAGWFMQRRQSQHIQRQIEDLDGLAGS